MQTWSKKITVKTNSHGLITGNTIGKNDCNYRCLIHLDRLNITFKHWTGSTFQDIRNPDYIPFEQVFNNITLIHDSSPGLGAFYHSYKVLYKGFIVGRLHAATKLKKHELQFDFAKDVFYAFFPGFWYEVYAAIREELGIIFNNIMYMEVSLDTDKNLVGQFGFYYRNTINYNLRISDRYVLRRNTKVHVMNNGSSFVIAGSDNEIAIYNKSKHAEEYILNYFSNNGLAGKEVNRIEARLSWNYIRYLRNKKRLDINIETLLNQKELARIFQVSTANKITFLDRETKTYDENRNPHWSGISIVDDLPIKSIEIGRLNKDLLVNHYKTGNIDENIMRQNYYKFLESGNRKYFQNFKASGSVAGYNRELMGQFIKKFNNKYNGNRTSEITDRMEYAVRSIFKKPLIELNELFYGILVKFKWNLMGIG